jgi:hypothetical protein
MSDSPRQEEASQAALAAVAAHHPGAGVPGPLAAGPAVRVERLDRPGDYLLVPLGDDAGLRGIVQLDALTLAVQSSVAIRDPAATFLTTEAQALAAAEAAFPLRRDWGRPFLAWRPCRESFDSLRPLWVVPHRQGQAYVTQSGRVFEALSTGKGG